MLFKKGDKINNLTVKRFSHHNDAENQDYYLCTCACERTVTLGENELKSGERTSCNQRGCNADMLGKQYGEWTVTEISRNFPSGKIKAKCSCGTEKMVNISDLKYGKSNSCGHGRSDRNRRLAELHIGEKWGQLTVLEPVLRVCEGNSRKNKYFYKCQCECGNIVEVAGQKLWSGHTKSCGCLKSSANTQLAAILKKHGVKFQAEYRFEDCKDKRPLPFDFAIFNKENELVGLIENNGEQHYLGIGRGFYTQAKLENITHHDFIKRKFCEDNQIPLLVIPFQFFGDKMEEFLTSSNLWSSLV